MDKFSIISTNKLSIFKPMEYRSGFGNFKNNLFHLIYKSLIWTITGKKDAGGGLCSHLIKKFNIVYDDIISTENLLLAWKEFLNGKRKRKDVRTFEIKLADNIFDLRDSLKFGTYKHGSYLAFTVHDPKRRNIHKASVRDRLLHRAIYRKLYKPYPTFSLWNRKVYKWYLRFIHYCEVVKGKYLISLNTQR